MSLCSSGRKSLRNLGNVYTWFCFVVLLKGQVCNINLYLETWPLSPQVVMFVDEPKPANATNYFLPNTLPKPKGNRRPPGLPHCGIKWFYEVLKEKTSACWKEGTLERISTIFAFGLIEVCHFAKDPADIQVPTSPQVSPKVVNAQLLVPRPIVLLAMIHSLQGWPLLQAHLAWHAGQIEFFPQAPSNVILTLASCPTRRVLHELISLKVAVTIGCVHSLCSHDIQIWNLQVHLVRKSHILLNYPRNEKTFILLAIAIIVLTRNSGGATTPTWFALGRNIGRTVVTICRPDGNLFITPNGWYKDAIARSLRQLNGRNVALGDKGASFQGSLHHQP